MKNARADVITLNFRRPRRRKNRKLIDRLLRNGYTLRLARDEEASRFDRR